tara:strand:- start:56 stop:688 length:633 start_codon:yes stop_codon:yes gene_type:complete
MEFSITSFQFDPKHLFDISYKVDAYISKAISQYLKDIDTGFNLIFSISCYSDNPKQLLIKDQSRGRKKPKEITQFLSFPYKELQYESGWELQIKDFDFKHKRKAYKSYPLDKYVANIMSSLKLFFKNEGIQIPLDFPKIQSEISNHLLSNPNEFRYKNEDLIHLEELIQGQHWSDEEPDGKKWKESEIGKKWLILKNKYFFDEKGELAKK